MDKPAHDLVATYFRRSVATMELAAGDEKLHRTIRTIADVIENVFRSGNKVLLAGNGGSAGDAQHIAGEFLSRLNFDRAPLAAIALTVDSSVLTAIGNDYGYEHVFDRQVRGLGRPCDVFLGISTSGRSPNVLRALATASECGLCTIGFTGAGGVRMAQACDLAFRAPSTST